MPRHGLLRSRSCHAVVTVAVPTGVAVLHADSAGPVAAVIPGRAGIAVAVLPSPTLADAGDVPGPTAGVGDGRPAVGRDVDTGRIGHVAGIDPHRAAVRVPDRDDVAHVATSVDVAHDDRAAAGAGGGIAAAAGSTLGRQPPRPEPSQGGAQHTA